MATTSIWRVKGYLSKVLIYAENPDKTENPVFYEVPLSDESGRQKLEDVIAYAAREDKVEQRHFVSGVNVNPNVARDQMLAVKHRFGKADGTVAYHGYQSFAPGETDPKTAHAIGVELAKRLWGDNFQVLIATHTDRGHVHNHFIVNTVSFIDGHRYRRTKQDYRDMRSVSDELCREAGLSVIQSPKDGKAKHYAEWKAEQDGKSTWRSLIKKDVDEAIAKSSSTRQFFDNLKNLGYELKLGKDISVRPPGKERFFRLERNFGEGYSEDAIKGRILSQRMPSLGIPKQSAQGSCYNPLPKIPKGTIVGLYRHYCYLFGVYKQDAKSNQRMPFALREELRYFDQITEDMKLLNRTDIKTDGELSSYKQKLEGDIATLVEERKRLQTIAKKSNNGKAPDTPEPRIAEINEELKKLRKEVRQCKRIEKRTQELEDKLPLIEKGDTPQTRKEVKEHGRNQPGNRPTRSHHAARV